MTTIHVISNQLISILILPPTVEISYQESSIKMPHFPAEIIRKMSTQNQDMLFVTTPYAKLQLFSFSMRGNRLNSYMSL